VFIPLCYVITTPSCSFFTNTILDCNITQTKKECRALCVGDLDGGKTIVCSKDCPLISSINPKFLTINPHLRYRDLVEKPDKPNAFYPEPETGPDIV